MRDEGWREWERRWGVNPGDQATLQALLTARRRAGLVVPGALLDQQVFPARAFASEESWEVFCELPARKVRRVGATPGADWVIPRHRAWWVRPLGVAELDQAGLERAVQALTAAAIPGISLRRAPLENRQLQPLRAATELTWLSLEGCARLTGPALEHLAQLEQLAHLSLEGCGRVTGGLRNLGQTALRNLNLAGCELTPSGLSALESLHSLTTVRVTGAPITANVLHVLGSLPQLARLDMPQSRFLGRVLRHLHDGPALAEVALPWSHLGDEDLEVLAELPGLRVLDLSFCRQISDVGLSALAGRDGLRELKLYGCEQLSNKIVPHLKPLSGLRRLDVSHTKLTKTRVASLRKALPECEVIDSLSSQATGKR